MPTDAADARATHTYRAKVTGRHAITLPAELCRRLGIAVGDAVEFELNGDQATFRLVEEKPAPQLRGLLRDYFKDWDDINRFIQEERNAWEDDPDEDQIVTSTNSSVRPSSSDDPFA